MSSEDFICQVCDKDIAIGVASSVLGGISFRYCYKCLQAGAEPYSALVGTLDRNPDNWAGWVFAVVGATLEIVGKTREELIADIILLDEEMNRYFREQEKSQKE